MRDLIRAIRTPPAVAAVPASSAMAGLERRVIGFVDVLAQSVGAVAPTAAAAATPALVAGQAGGSLLFCMLVAWLLVAGVAYAVGQFTRRMRAPGSLYTFTTNGLGPHAGFAAACALIAGYGFVAMFGLTGAALYLRDLVEDVFGIDPGRWGMAGGIVVLGAVCLVVLRCGIRLSARVTLVVEAVAVLVTLALLAIVLARADPGTLLDPFTARLPGPGALAAGTAVAMTAFVGFESAAALGREARRPFFVIPRAMRWTLVAVGLAYVFAMYTEQVGAGSLGVRLADNDLAMSQLAVRSDVPWLGRLLEVGQATSLVACAIASLTALSRVVFTLGREGLLPAAVGFADPLRGTPLGALAVVVPVTVLVPVVMVADGSDPWQVMSVLLAVSAVGYLTAYALTAAAAPAFLRRIGELTPLTAITSGVVAGVLGVVVVIYLVVIGGDRPVSLWLCVAVAVAALAAYVVARRSRAAALAGMGLFDQTTAADLLGAEPLDAPGRP
ncbi:MAG: APC family permease [Nocardioides sp.]|uniref:APC family permease n=1 Tax=Nocardioides sp. TaxID=35761 RepID=UPI0039E6B3DA